MIIDDGWWLGLICDGYCLIMIKIDMIIDNDIWT